jgi:hypothetical protein
MGAVPGLVGQRKRLGSALSASLRKRAPEKEFYPTGSGTPTASVGT